MAETTRASQHERPAEQAVDPKAAEWLRQTLARLRERLIDLGKRNPLVSFKHSERGASFLRVIDERPDQLFEALTEGAMTFEPLPTADDIPKDEQTGEFRIALERAKLTSTDYLAEIEQLGDAAEDEEKVQAAERKLRARLRAELGLPRIATGKGIDIAALARAHGFDPSFELGEDDGEEAPAHHRDEAMRVLLTADRLDTRLRTIYDRYRGHAAETGLHTLYLCFGFVEWFEDAESKLPLHAPALILPVQLERRLVRSRYLFSLSGRDEELQVNVAMRELLKQKFHIDAPALRENETPESYFIRLRGVLEQDPRARLALRRFVTLAVLPFPKMVLWQDLDPAVWPDQYLDRHPLLPRLLGAAGGGDSVFLPDYPLDEPELADRVPPIVLPADSSQHSAIIDAVEGKSMAIEGPPGTGKSQTIGNMIAAALDAGKRVLFVAEKQTALDVVAKRLSAEGFGPLLLQLHSDRSTKQELHREVRERLEARAPRDLGELDALRAELAEKKAILRRYMALLNAPLGALGRSAHQLVWREIALRAVTMHGPPALHAERLDHPERVSGLGLKRARATLDNIGEKVAEILVRQKRLDDSPWHAATRLPGFDQDPILAAGQGVLAALDVLIAETACLQEAGGVVLPTREDQLQALATHMTALADPAGFDDDDLKAALRDPTGTTRLLSRRRDFDAAREVAEQFHPDPLAPDETQLAALDRAADALPTVVSLAEARQVEAQVELGIAGLDKMGTALAPIFERFRIGPEEPVAKLDTLLESLLDVAELPAPAFDLRSIRLLDDNCGGRIAAARRDAEALEARAAELAGTFRIEAGLAADPVRLKQNIDILETTGLFGRWFGREYKVAWRDAGALFLAAPERAEAVGPLRALHELVEDRAQFFESSPVRGLFADEWRGAGSDWPSLAQAHATLNAVADRLTAIGRAAAAEGLATDSGRILRPLTRAAADAAPHRAGLGSFAEDSVARQRERWQADGERLATLIAAAEASGLREDAPFRHPRGRATDAVRSFQAADASLRASPGVADLWRWFEGPATPLQGLGAAAAYVSGLKLSELPPELSGALRNDDEPVRLAIQARKAGQKLLTDLSHWAEARAGFCRMIEADPTRFFHLHGGGDELGEQRARLAAALSDEEGLKLFASLGIYLYDAQVEGCRFVFDAALTSGKGLDCLADLYELIVVRSLVRQYLHADGADLQRLGGLGLAGARKRFGELDDALQKVEAKRILAKRIEEDGPQVPWGNDRGPRGTWTEAALLHHQISLQRRHIPIRDLVERAGTALARLKPVWMMSPTSAAQYIKPGASHFDLVLIDEASQMRPEYAVGAIARGAQLIVVGDSNQLPPTDFFAMKTADMESEDDEDFGIDTESILDLASEKLPHKRSLNWHYRSEHESLIQFSNRQFYKKKLVVFPSPSRRDALLGVQHRFVPERRYESQINEPEAKAVIEEAYAIMVARPELTMAIVTMNISQRELVWVEFERLRSQDATVRSYFERHERTTEPFIIKNLESIQGDESDIVLISTVYGPDKDGTIHQRFTGFNSKVGHRRLNVLVTRAKQMTKVITSLHPDDIKVLPTSNPGVGATQAYLRYAAGGAQFDHGGSGEAESDFETFVAGRLRAAGYEVDYQVGVEGFRIDLGVRHASFPLGYIAGVECDGATFHSGLTVRDRDRIRQAILERLGWNIHRVWSTDWFASSDQEMARLLARLDTWRAAAAASYETRRNGGEFDVQIDDEPPPQPAHLIALPDPSNLVAEPEPEPKFEPSIPPAPAPAPETIAASPDELDGERERPVTKRHDLDDIEFYDIVRGSLYEVWVDDAYAGDVERLSGGVVAPRLYGGSAAAQLPQYRGTVEATGNEFVMNDIHATVRRVAKEAREARA